MNRSRSSNQEHDMTDTQWSDAVVEAAVDAHRKAIYEQDLTHHDAMRAALIAADRATWQPISEAIARGQALPVVVAVTGGPHGTIVGEAWRDDDGEWWWANTSEGDYHASSISEGCFGRVTEWRPLPTPPAQGDGETGSERSHKARRTA